VVKTSLNLNKARDDGASGWQWHQLDHAISFNKQHLGNDDSMSDKTKDKINITRNFG